MQNYDDVIIQNLKDQLAIERNNLIQSKRKIDHCARFGDTEGMKQAIRENRDAKACIEQYTYALAEIGVAP